MADSLLDLAELLAALANGRGGTLILPSRQPAALIDRLLQAALMTDPPLILPIPETARDQKSAVLVSVPPGLPHVYAVNGRYLIREGNESVPLSPGQLRQLLIERGALSFEDEVVIEASLDDLNWTAVESYTARIGSVDPRETLLRRGCLRRVNGELRPTHAGLLLFGQEPTDFIRGAFITAARFAGQQMSDVFTRVEITGSLPDQIRRAETFLIDHLRKDVQLSATMERHERYEIPLEAAREVVVNAVAHRDYSIQGDGIRLYLFSDRMEVTSPGRLAGPVTLDNLVDERFSRNSIIVQVLSDMGFIERLGYGIDRILALMKAGQHPNPGFSETSGGFRVTLCNETDMTEPALSPFSGIILNPRQQTALEYLNRHASITNRQYQELCPDVHSETLRRDLADLVTKRIIERLGEKRGSYYVLVKR